MGNIIGIALVWFIIEMLLWYLLAQFISGWWVFGWFVVAAVLGIVLIKKGFGSLKPMAVQMQGAGLLNPSLRPPEDKITKAIALGLAGVLFALPGVLSDLVALILLLPPVQNKAKQFAKNYASKNPEKLMQMVASQMGGINPSMMSGMGGMMGGMSGFGGANPFGTNSPFGSNNPFGNANPMAKGKFGGTTIDGQAKQIKHKKSANDE